MVPLDDLSSLLAQAQAGDAEARGKILDTLRPFVHAVACACCRRTLYWGNDDELSVALLALDEAIASYREEAGRKFQNHARQVIAYRLIDYFRREGRHQHLSLEAMTQAAEEEVAPALEVKAAWEAYRIQEESAQRLAEIAEYNRLLGEYGLSLADLKNHCPKHTDTRQHLMRIARALCEQPHLVQHLRRTRQLPLRELQLVSGASRKVLETGRRYILALAVLILSNHLEFLRAFAGLERAGRGE